MLIWPTPRPALKAAISILQDAFGAVRVSDQMPKTRPAQFVRVDRVGGGQLNPRVDRARLLVECWGPSSGVVETMVGTAREALRNAGGTTVSDGIFIHSFDNEDGVAHYDDPDVTDQRRWQFTGDLLVSTRANPGS
jgi:hypothetical protein